MRGGLRVPAAIGLIVLGGRLYASAAQGPQSPTLPALLDEAALYLDTYAKQLAAVIATEAYTFRGGGLLGNVDGRRPTSLQSDVMLLGADANWIEFRDVFEVNHQPVRDHDSRLQALLSNPSGDLLAEADKIANESARYNLGIARNINVPTMALSYLTRRYQPRSTFEIAGHDTIDGVRVTAVRFKETATPPLIKVSIGTAKTSGRFWIAGGTGAVLRTEIELDVPRATVQRAYQAVNGSVTVDYAPDPELKILVPSRMHEHYDQPQSVDGQATYSHFRSFGVDVSTLMRKAGGGGE